MRILDVERTIAAPYVHHHALEYPDGEAVLLTYLMEGQQATVLQLPTAAVGPLSRPTRERGPDLTPDTPRVVPRGRGRHYSGEL